MFFWGEGGWTPLCTIKYCRLVSGDRNSAVDPALQVSRCMCDRRTDRQRISVAQIVRACKLTYGKYQTVNANQKSSNALALLNDAFNGCLPRMTLSCSQPQNCHANHMQKCEYIVLPSIIRNRPWCRKETPRCLCKFNRYGVGIGSQYRNCCLTLHSFTDFSSFVLWSLTAIPTLKFHMKFGAVSFW